MQFKRVGIPSLLCRAVCPRRRHAVCCGICKSKVSCYGGLQVRFWSWQLLVSGKMCKNPTL